MADIDVVRKRGVPAWVWGLLALIAVIAVIAMMTRGGDDTSDVAPRTDSTPAVTPSALSA